MKKFFRPLFVVLIGLLLQPFATAAIIGKVALAHAFVGFANGLSLFGVDTVVALGVAGTVNMLDIAKLSGNDTVVGLIEENIKSQPEVELFPMRTVKGTSYKTGIRTGLPTAGFRAANAGQTPGKSTFRQALIECFIFGGNIQADVAVADAHEDGAAAFQAIEANGIMQAAMRSLGTQVWYGITADDKGFPGIKASTPKAGTTLAGDLLCIDATGTTALTASSVYAVKFGEQHVQLIGGRNTAFQLGEFYKQMVAGSVAGTTYEAYVAALTGWIGMQIGNENCVRRICNLTADSGKGLTDLLLADLMNTFPAGWKPDALFMSRRSRTQLQKARTVVLQGSGKNRPDQPTLAPTPTEYEGVPIYATDSILNTDAIE